MPDLKNELRIHLCNLNLEPVRENEIIEELNQHIEDRCRDLIAEGLSESSALKTAISEFTENDLLAMGLRRVERSLKPSRAESSNTLINLVSGTWQDVRVGARMLVRSPAFTAIAILSLALGVGANTAIFQLLNAVRMKTLPVKDPGQLVEVRIKDMTGARGNFATDYQAVTHPIWEHVREKTQGLAGVFACSSRSFNLAQGGEVRLANALLVSGDAFDVLGVRPMLGRVLTNADDQRGCSKPAVVISNSFWQREYGNDPEIIGRKLTLSDQPFEIVGVSNERFYGLEVGHTFDVAVPLCAEPLLSGNNKTIESGTTWWLMVTGRLRPGWSVAQVSATLASISPGLFKATLPANYPEVNVKDYLGFTLEAVGVASGYSLVRRDYERPLFLLFGIAALVLLIACANLANLLLVRASGRRTEIAVRLAVGASRFRLIRQLIAESLLLAGLGAIIGAVLAQFLSKLLLSFLNAGHESIFLDLGFDWRLLGFELGVAIFTCLLFGVIPALRATRVECSDAMKSGGRALSADTGRFNLRRLLVVLQVSISLVLVCGALLFVRSLTKLSAAETGFNPDGVLIARVGFRRLNIQPENILNFRRDILDRLRAIPGVDALASTEVVPISGDSIDNNVWLDGTDGHSQLDSTFSLIGPGYFNALRIPIIAGRDFDEHDTADSPKVAIVSQTFAHRLLGADEPIGKRFWIEATPGTPKTEYEIVGVAGDVKYRDLRENFGPVAFLASYQDKHPFAGGQFLIHSRLSQNETAEVVKRSIAEINPALDVSFQGMQTLVADSLVRDRLMATLSAFFGVLALLLASIGLYGILAFGVASRTREIGIRMALGAQTGKIRFLILREALLLVAVGTAIGLPVALILTRSISSLLYGLDPTDPATIAAAILLLFGVSLLAGYIPARRATRLDPMSALRYE